MGTSVRLVDINSSERSREENPTTKWLNWVLRKRRWRPLTSPSMSTTSREMAMLSFLRRRSPPCLQPQPHPQNYCWDRRRVRKRQEDAEEGRGVPHLQGCQGLQGPGWIPRLEILKLYDKNNDDTMMGHELFRLLTNLGEKLNKEEAKNLMKELCEPEDDDGFMPFKPFLERMCSNE